MAVPSSAARAIASRRSRWLLRNLYNERTLGKALSRISLSISFSGENSSRPRCTGSVYRTRLAFSQKLYTISLKLRYLLCIVYLSQYLGEADQNFRTYDLLRTQILKSDIEVLDHLVIRHQRYVSLKERGLGFS